MLRGAEAVLVPCSFLGHSALRKERREKSYRIKEIDSELRLGRTRREARLLHKAKEAGVSCPTVYAVGENCIVIDRLLGGKLKENPAQLRKAGEMLAKLHSAGIIHGDFTPYNIIVNSSGLHVIDFGLGFISYKLEDQADDVLNMLRGIKGRKYFLEGYSEFSGAKQVLKRIGQIEARMRYR